WRRPRAAGRQPRAHEKIPAGRGMSATVPRSRSGWWFAPLSVAAAVAALTVVPADDPPAKNPPAADVRELMRAATALENVLFRDVVRAATGFEIIEVRSRDPVDRAMLNHLSAAA